MNGVWTDMSTHSVDRIVYTQGWVETQGQGDRLWETYFQGKHVVVDGSSYTLCGINHDDDWDWDQELTEQEFIADEDRNSPCDKCRMLVHFAQVLHKMEHDWESGTSSSDMAEYAMKEIRAELERQSKGDSDA